MTDRYSHFIVECKKKPTKKTLQALTMVRRVLTAQPIDDQRVLVILERDMRDDDFECVENAVTSMGFVSGISDRQQVYPKPDVELRSAVQDAVLAMKPALKGKTKDQAPDAETIAEYVGHYRHWCKLSDEIHAILWKREH